MALCRPFFSDHLPSACFRIGKIRVDICGTLGEIGLMQLLFFLFFKPEASLVYPTLIAGFTIFYFKNICRSDGIPDPCPDFETAVLPQRLAHGTVY